MRSLCWSLVLWSLAAAAQAAIEGLVVTASGTPIEHARIEVAGDSMVTFTDPRGRFRFEEAEPPLELQVSHPRFQTRTITAAATAEQPLEIPLTPKQEVFEEIAVSANRGEENFSPVSVATSVVEPDEIAAPPSTLTEMVAALPAVAENGQGGIFQTYSIRGVSRQRVLTLVAGMRIVSERRAGVSASFLDPRLLGSVDVLRGPSSTYWGSGALGGVVQLFPRRFESLSVEAGYASQGDETYQLLGWGNGDWSLGIARRDASEAETPAGEPLFSGFTQTSGAIERSWSTGGMSYQVQVLGSVGEDIGKANTDFPDRTTLYPEEEHLLARFAARSDGDWRLEVWAHPNTLETRVEEAATVSLVENEAFDFGVNWQKQLRIAGTSSTRVGLDYFARRGVTALETDRDGVSGDVRRQETLRDGEEDEAGLYGALEWNWGPAVILAGGRLAWQRQRNADQPSTDDSAVSGFAGLVVPLGSGFELASNVGSGLRFPSLSERFFSGVTGRGEVIGNAELEPERSLNLDVGLRWYGDNLFVSGYVFRNEIDDYIERIRVGPDLLTFVNLTSGTIEGVELEGLYRFDRRWSLSFGGHLLEGRDDADQSLADVPADRLFVGAIWRRRPWSANVRWEERSEKDDPGSGERPIPAASLVSASLDYAFANGLSLTLSGRNLLDEEYFNSADDKVAPAPGRSIGLALRWQRR